MVRSDPALGVKTMNGPVPDPAEFWANLAKASPEEVMEALNKAGFLSTEQLGQLQALVADGQVRGRQPQQPAPAPTVDAPAREDVVPHIGPYRLLQELGEGGMGTVFLAEQQHPVERRVALKIIKAGMDSRQVLARFEAEEQALAMMDHPNIAKVFDAGVTQAGRPYFVMELVRGIPITAVLRPGTSHATRTAGAVHPCVSGRAACAPEGDHPP